MGRWGEFAERRRKFEPEGHVVSGRLAEYRLFKLARAVSGNALVLEGIRIPDPEEGGRREIDMVIATSKEILFVEQKHWSGSFTITSEGRFLQKRKNGSFLEHKDIIAWTARKGDILCDLHENRTDCSPPPSRTILVFSNPNLEWRPLPADAAAEAYDELGFINMLEKMERDAPDGLLKETLLGFGTWDTIHLNGGKTLHGDILDFPFQRINCEIWHSGFFGLLTGPKSIITSSLNPMFSAEIRDLSGLLVSVVGEDGARVIPFAHISSIEFSNPRAAWG